MAPSMVCDLLAHRLVDLIPPDMAALGLRRLSCPADGLIVGAWSGGPRTNVQLPLRPYPTECARSTVHLIPEGAGMFGKKTLVTAAVTATALMSPAAVFASGGASGSGHNSSSSSTNTTTPAPPAECAAIGDVTITQGQRLDASGQPDGSGMYWTEAQAPVVNCGTQTESLRWEANYTNTNTGIQEFTSGFTAPISVAPGGSIDNMAVVDAVTDTVPGKSYRWDFIVKSATTGKVIAQKSAFSTIIQ